MTAAVRHASRAAAAGLLALHLGACAGPGRNEAAFNPDAGGRLLNVAFHNIYDKYIDPVPMGHVAESALRRMEALDEDISVRHDGDRFVLTDRGTVIAAVEPPADDNPSGWARLTTQIGKAHV